ncbi:MAG: helix-turn-helix transcriptional regulator [Spirochaetales bacterium]|nr:helix-turn-helix transcriptional regulator [Spirochaetales bacterium]
MESSTNDLLLNRFTQFGKGSSPVIENWEKQYKGFGDRLESLLNNPYLTRQDGIKERLDGAYRVWRFTEVRLNNADYYFKQIIQSGLGEKVMVNGMLHTMYQMRMQNQLSVNEICLLEETVCVLESLDNVTDEFDFLFHSIVHDMNAAGEVYLKRVRALLFALFFSAVVVLIVFVLIYRQLNSAQINRRVYLESRKARLMRNLCKNSSEEELSIFKKKEVEYELEISIDKPVMIIMFQIDNFNDFSHKYNIEEQQSKILNFCFMFSAFLKETGYKSEYFRYEDEFIVYMLNSEDSNNYELFEQNLRKWHKNNLGKQDFSVSVTISDICLDNQDLDRDFEYLQRLSEYRYLMGSNAFITPGSWDMVPDEEFRYPLEKQRQFEETIKSLNDEEALVLMNEMLDYAKPYGPETIKRFVIRFAASLVSVVELLEKSYHLPPLEGVVPMILAIQKKNTIDETAAMLEGVIIQVTDACKKKKSEKHDHNVELIKDIINSSFADFNLSADQIADKFNLTTSYINRLFKQHTTLSIAGYINECRLLHAEELLKTSDKTVAQIAEQSGFASMGTFFRLFKKRFGLTPGEMATKYNFNLTK